MHARAHGVDLVEIARITAMLDRHAERFAERCFTVAERAYADAGKRRRSERYAGRFAAKEAVLKALGTGWSSGIAWTDVEVLRAPSGQPGVRLTGEAAAIAARRGIDHWLISLSHTDDLAMASVIGVGSTGTSAPES
ncbi:MAG: holo-ACP synthase [Planctomycetota bacterium]